MPSSHRRERDSSATSRALPNYNYRADNTHLADHLGHWGAALRLAQRKGDPLFRVSRPLHAVILLKDQNA